MKIKILSLAALVCFIACAQEPVKVLTITNLTDKLHTKVEYDKSTGMDIRRLNLDSIHADKHKARATAVKDLSINVRRPSSITMVRPLFTKDDDGNVMRVKNGYIDVQALARNDVKNIVIDSAKTKKLLVQDLTPAVFCLKDNKLDILTTKRIQISDRKVDGISINNIGVNSIGVNNIDIKTLSIDELDVGQLNIASLKVGAIDVSAIKTISLAICSLLPYSILVKSFGLDGAKIAALGIDSLNINSLAVNGIDVSKMYVMKPTVTDLNAAVAKVSKLSPKVINLYDASGNLQIIVIDNSQYSVDESWADVEVTEETYAELAEMKLIYNFEQDYNESIKTAVKLKDLQTLERPMYLKWIKLLSHNKKCNIEFIKNKKYWKIGGEAWILNNKYTCEDRNNLMNNIEFLKERGYNSMLVRFDCTEDIDLLLQLINDIKATGLEVFCAYVGIDNRKPRWMPYIEPETIDKYFAVVTPKSVGLLLNWRTTSNHIRILPIEYFNYISMMARKYNPQILIYGEAYYGVIGPLYMTTLVYTIPENSTGLVINNMGYYGYNFKYIINGMFTTMIPNYKKLNKICQVVGIAPYYCSRPEHKQDLTLDKEYEYKDKVEKGFKRIGCSTITMLHDGVDDNYTKLFDNEKDQHAVYDTIDNVVYDTKILEQLDEKEAAGEL